MNFIDDFLSKHKNDGLAERIFRGLTVSPYIKDIARLRVETLRDFPYLYSSDLNREIQHLEKTYLASNDSWFLLYLSSAGIVGGIGITPLDMLPDGIKEPFIINGLDISKYMYIGEAMLLKDYRGRGIFKNMLSFAEKQAKYAGKKHVVFSYVEREDTNNSGKMSGSSLWENYGYSKIVNSCIEQKWVRSDSGVMEKNELFLWEKPI